MDSQLDANPINISGINGLAVDANPINISEINGLTAGRLSYKYFRD